ncbi:hypothetical protein T4A_7493 [Trichinella pseudospiralis]|uniref:Uncharacterized protein n=1 Tax=Trichinella pseudospiralis TaxID=6337 RepID=A0A0V1K1Z3_TRIPS|nr:hypothetical protein T4A_7493 [Trichinella pseudospiralis]KRZ40821.1 hypothetical protein T4C_10547 [Trichinella pseudospiralis]
MRYSPYSRILQTVLNVEDTRRRVLTVSFLLWRFYSDIRIYRREHSKTVFTKTRTMSEFYANRDRLKIAFTLSANGVR